MIAMRHFVPRGFCAGLVLAIFGAGALPRLRAQKSPADSSPPAAQTRSKPRSPARVDSLASLLQQAQAAIDKNNFIAGIGLLEKYIAKRPDEPYPHFQLGYAYSSLKRWDEARQEFTRAVALDPKMAPAHLNLGLVLLKTDPAAAAQSFERAAQLMPKQSRPRFLAGYAFEQAGKFPDAVAEYRSALELSPRDYEAHVSLGRVLLRQGDAADAEEHFRQAIAARSNSVPAHLGLANALQAQKKYNQEAGALADYLKLDPADRGARLDRASALIQLGRLDQALAELDRADQNSAPTADSLKMRADVYLRQKKWQRAGDTLTQAVSLSPRDPDLIAQLGHVKIQQRDYAGAITMLGRAYALNPKSPEILQDLADAFFLHQDYAATLGAMDRLAALQPPTPVSWFVRGICYDKLSRKQDAMAAYQKFLNLDNGRNDTQDFQARQRIATLQHELGKTRGKERR